jgi:hypothetical protein
MKYPVIIIAMRLTTKRVNLSTRFIILNVTRNDMSERTNVPGLMSTRMPKIAWITVAGTDSIKDCFILRKTNVSEYTPKMITPSSGKIS